MPFLHGVKVVQDDSGARATETVSTAEVGILIAPQVADNTVFPINEPVRIEGSLAKIAQLPPSLSRTYLERIFKYHAADVCVMRVPYSADPDTQMSHFVGSAANFSGAHGFLRSQSHIGIKPRLLLAPGYTSQRPGNAANPVVGNLALIAEKLRALVYADAPADSITAAQTWRADFNQKRVYAWSPMVKVWDAVTSTYVDQVVTPSIVGMQVYLDHKQGYWHSPSNKELSDIGGTSRPIDFRMGDPTSEAQLLNDAHLNTVINFNGWRSWGNRTLENADSNWYHATAVRIFDVLADTIEKALFPFVDRPMQVAWLRSIAETGNAWIAEAVRLGALAGGSMWFDKQDNPALNLGLGRLRTRLDYAPTPPIEGIEVTAQRNSIYYDYLFEDVLAEINRSRQLAA
jgi:uncharacterized protein